jgi:hypothetical protein
VSAKVCMPATVDRERVGRPVITRQAELVAAAVAASAAAAVAARQEPRICLNLLGLAVAAFSVAAVRVGLSAPVQLLSAVAGATVCQVALVVSAAQAADHLEAWDRVEIQACRELALEISPITLV